MTDEKSQEYLWELSDVPCPFCPRNMHLVGRERVQAQSAAELLTFQCDCGQVTSSTTDN